MADVKVGDMIRQSTYVAFVDHNTGLVIVRSRWAMYKGMLIRFHANGWIELDRKMPPATDELSDAIKACRAMMAK